MRDKKLTTVIVAIWIGSVLFSLMVTAGIIIIAIHFIKKFW